MRLKLYHAPGMTEAMARVRAELGPDAVILGTRRVAGGVEVTAGLDSADGALPAVLVPHRSEPLRLLAWHGVPASLASRLGNNGLEAGLAELFRFQALKLAPGDAPLLLAGPPGAGKTLTVARLATRLVMAGESPLIITADGRRAGATEQLAAFTRLLGLTLVVASHPVTLARALARRKAGAPVLIDAPGTDPFDPAQRDEITSLATAAGAVTALVQPAGIDPNEAADSAAAFAEGGATALVTTRLDLSRRLGGVLASARAGDLALVEAGIGPGAADGLVPMTPGLLAERLRQQGATAHAHPLAESAA